MADLTQRVKYTVEVDSSALATLRLEISTGIIALESWEKGMRAAVEASKKAGSAFASVTSKMQANTLASARAELELKDLIKAQNAAGTASANLATHVAGLNTAFREMKSAGAQAKNAVENVQKASTAAGKAADGAAAATDKSGFRFLQLFGKFQAAKWIVTEVFQAIKEGAQQVDLDRTLTRQLANYSKTLADAKTATAGMVSTAALQKSMALMSSFGIPMERFAESMELVQKMAIRTGQSAEYLSQSFSTGISRLSPKILDNLGIQISLKDAYEAFAQSVGKATTELTKEEQTAAVLNATLKDLKKNTEGVSLTGVAGTAARFDAKIENAKNEVKGWLALQMDFLDSLGEGVGTSSSKVIDALRMHLIALKKDFAQVTNPSEGEKLNYEIRTEHLKNQIEALVAMAKDPALNRWFAHDLEEVDPISGTAVDWGRTADSISRQFNLAQKLAAGQMADADNTATWDEWAAAAATEFGFRFKTKLQGELSTLKEVFGDSLSPDAYADLAKELDGLTNKFGMMPLAMSVMTTNAEHNFNKIRKLDVGGTAKEWDAAFDAIVKHGSILAKNKQTTDESTKAFDAFVTALHAQAEAQELASGALKDQVQIEQIYNSLKAEESRLVKEIKDKTEELNTARETAQGKEAATALAILLDKQKTVQAQIAGAKKAYDDQEDYFEGFKRGSDMRRKEEIARLNTLILQMKTQLFMNQLLAGTVALMGENAAKAAGIFVDPKQAKAQMQEWEATANRLEKMKSGGGGGGAKPPKDKPEFGDQDDLEKMLADWNAFELEVRQSAGEIREEAQAASDEARGLMFGLTNQNPQTSISPKEYEETKKQWERVLELKNEFGTMIDMGLDEGAMSMLNSQFAELANHFEKIANMADGMHKFADGLQSAFAGMEGLVGGEYVAMMGDLVQGFEGLSQAIGENANAYGMMNAVAPIMRAFTHNLIKDRKAQAGIEMLMQGAAAWAAAATGNIPAAVAHGISAAMYGGIAGGLIKLPKGKASEDKPGADRNGKAAPRPDIHIYISGPIATTEAERGLMIRDALQAASRQGL